MWYRALRNFAKEDFREAIINLIETEKFLSAENFNIVEAIVSRARRYEYLRKQFDRDLQKIGCKDCVAGRIHFIEDRYEVVAYCNVCYPERPKAVDPKIPREYVMGMEPLRHRGKKYIAPHILKEMMKDLYKKMVNPNTDWKMEVEKANKMHEQS